MLLFLVALFTQFVRPHTPISIQLLYAFSLVCIEFIWFAFVAILLTHPLLKKRYEKLTYWIEKAAGLIFIVIAGSLVFF